LTKQSLENHLDFAAQQNEVYTRSTLYQMIGYMQCNDWIYTEVTKKELAYKSHTPNRFSCTKAVAFSNLYTLLFLVGNQWSSSGEEKDEDDELTERDLWCTLHYSSSAISDSSSSDEEEEKDEDEDDELTESDLR
jgi:hypothetical protein